MKNKGKSSFIKILMAALVLVITFVVFVFFINQWSIEITLKGSELVELEYGTFYEDEGTQAYLYGSLIFKDGFPIKIFQVGEIDWSKKGEQEIFYYAEGLGKKGQVKRLVKVVDTTAPQILLTYKAEVYTLPGTVYEEEGYSAKDNYDGDITEKVTREERDGVVYYTVMDSSGNIATVHREIVYDDPIAPEITLIGESEIVLEVGTVFEEPGYTALDNVDGDLTASVTVTGIIDMSQMGTYILTYSVNDTYQNTANVQRIIIVKDSKFPDIKLEGSSKLVLKLGKDYKEPGYMATDNYDGEITSAVTVTGSVNKNKIGTYTLTYTVTDSSGNTTTVTRTVIYEEKEPPKLTLKGDTKITIQAGIKYKEPGYTATDNYDGDITSAVKVTGNVNIYKSGTYTLTYAVTDSSGNKATAQRTVTVKAIPQPDTVVPNGKVIYLTFDDGPGIHTQRLLDILDKYNVKVTFFTVNNSYAHMMAKEAAAGHTVAIHTSSHVYSEIYASEEAFLEDFYKQQRLIESHTGICTKLFRFPGGSSNLVSAKYNQGIMTRLVSMLTEMGYTYFDWDVDSKDAANAKTSEEIFQNVINGVQKRNVSVVLQHDTKSITVDATEKIIIWGLANGYTFLPLDASSPTAHHTIKN